MSNVRCCDVDCLMQLAKPPPDPIAKFNVLDQLVSRSVFQLHLTSHNSQLTFDNRGVSTAARFHLLDLSPGTHILRVCR